MRRSAEKTRKFYAELEKDLKAKPGWPAVRCPSEKGQGIVEWRVGLSS